jgi:hypothetical protein
MRGAQRDLAARPGLERRTSKADSQLRSMPELGLRFWTEVLGDQRADETTATVTARRAMIIQAAASLFSPDMRATLPLPFPRGLTGPSRELV